MTIQQIIEIGTKKYGSKNAYLASDEYRKIYPQLQAMHKNNRITNKIEKNSDGLFVIRRGTGFLASDSNMGLFGGIATFETEAQAIEAAKKYNIPL